MSTIYTDGSSAYRHAHEDYAHEAVRHSIGEYVRGQAHTNGIESFWSLLKRAHMGTFHKLSPKHLHRYVTEFAGRKNVQNEDTITQIWWLGSCSQSYSSRVGLVSSAWSSSLGERGYTCLKSRESK